MWTHCHDLHQTPTNQPNKDVRKVDSSKMPSQLTSTRPEARGLGGLDARRPRLLTDAKVLGGSAVGPKPYKFIGFGDSHGPKPYKFIGFGDIHGHDSGCFMTRRAQPYPPSLCKAPASICRAFFVRSRTWLMDMGPIWVFNRVLIGL